MRDIYQQEITDGLESLIQNDFALAYTTNYKLINLTEMPTIKVSASSGANPDQIDLLYLETILASTGMNENDDIFISSELLKAKNTPIDKPFNYMHNESFIIGHITSSRLVDREGKEIVYSNDEELPVDLDLITGAVIYKHYESEEKSKFIADLIDQIFNDEYFVSMECLLNHFDYGLTASDGSQRIIPRTKETAFLTKYLRRYKGSGEYEGCKIGRVLRDYVFSGKGLVDNPANKRSHILSVANKQELEMSKEIVAASVQELKVGTALEGMVSKTEYDSLKVELAEMKKAVASKIETEIETYKKEIVKANESLDNSKNLSAEKDAKITELETAIAELTTAKSALETELNSIKGEQIKATRIAALVDVGVERAKAEELVVKFASADETMFSELVSLNKKTVASTTTTLEAVKPDQTAPLTEVTVDVAEKTRASVQAWIGKVLDAKAKK
jgi:hypothetical protein